jgi:hypothetical protein
MKYQKPVNNVNSNDEFSSGLMEAYGQWMGGDCFQNTSYELNLSEAPFDGMNPQSNGAEIEDTTKRKKTAKKGSYVGQESSPAPAPAAEEVEYEVLETEDYEIGGETWVLEKRLYAIEGSMKAARDNVGASTCWKGYKAKGTKKKGGKEVPNCVKAGVEYEGDELTEKKLDPVGKADADIDNDGDVDKSDKYLHMRRKKVSKIIGMAKKK